MKTIKKIVKYGCIGMIALVILGAICGNTDKDKKETVKQEAVKQEEVKQETPAAPAQPKEPEATTEQKNALNKAESYSKMFHDSKAEIYDQLTSEYGDKFTPEDAQYAIDHLQADYNANALATAKRYQEMFHDSKAEIYEQLTSEYGSKFTPEEAQYAIDNLGE